MKKLLLLGSALLLLSGGIASAQIPGNTVKIGVVSVVSGPYSDEAG
jgi:hypothetical protein